MKRDMDLIREILLRIEDHTGEKARINMDFDNFTESEVMYQTKLLYEAGFINAYDASSVHHSFYEPIDLTWQGHEFLDAARNQNVWNSTKEMVKKYGGPIPLELLKSLLIKSAAAYLGLGK